MTESLPLLYFSNMSQAGLLDSYTMTHLKSFLFYLLYNINTVKCPPLPFVLIPNSPFLSVREVLFSQVVFLSTPLPHLTRPPLPLLLKMTVYFYPLVLSSLSLFHPFSLSFQPALHAVFVLFVPLWVFYQEIAHLKLVVENYVTRLSTLCVISKAKELQAVYSASAYVCLDKSVGFAADRCIEMYKNES